MRFQAPVGMLLFASKSFHRGPPRTFWQRYRASTACLSDTLCSAKKRAIEEDSPLRIQLDVIESKIAKLNDGRKINCNSPKQVSALLFGNAQSVSKAVLQSIVLNYGTDSREKQIAELVLEYRNLQNGEHTPRVEGTAPHAQGTTLDHGTISAAETATSNKNEELSEFDREIEHIFSAPKCKVNAFWKDHLRRLTRPSARSLVSQLDANECPMGYNPLARPFSPLKQSDSAITTTTAGKKGSFLSYCREQKERYPECIVLTRCGDFYEAFGTDAILLVEHCGLNSMAGKARAGCPIRNVQSTLDCLTEAGFRVAVYEEGADTDTSPAKASAGSKSRIKSRFLAQIVSSAAPTYLYDLVLQGDQADTLSKGPQARPYVGIVSSKAGYTVTEVSIEERTVRISERLTPEAVACQLATNPPVDPLIFVPAPGENTVHLPFLPSPSSVAPRLRTKIVPPELVQQLGTDGDEMERVKSVIVSEVLKLDDSVDESHSHERFSTSVRDFTTVSLSSSVSSKTTSTNPLHVETATQLGLMDDKAIPSLVNSLLPVSAPAATRRFLRRYLLTPPPPSIGESLAILIDFLRNKDGPSLPPLSIPPLGKVLSMLRAGQASAEVFSEILRTLHSTIQVVDTFEKQGKTTELSALITILQYESGMATDADSLRQRCHEAIIAIEEVICPFHHVSHSDTTLHDDELVTDFGEVVPRGFFERNEAPWRGRVRRDAAPRAYAEVEKSAERLLGAVAQDYWGLSPEELKAASYSVATGRKCVIVQDIFNNLFALKTIPSELEDAYIHPRDRFGKLLKTRYTTEKVQDALLDYVSTCDKACEDVAEALQRLSTTLDEHGHIPAIVQASHSNLILSTAFQHAIKANSVGWSRARTVKECDDEGSAGRFCDVWPYWMDRSQAVPNTFDLEGMWVLTAPNMSGKSTVMRSTAVAALLTICGLCAPLKPESWVRRFDSIFIRGASSDVPAEGKSAFGAEMGDVAAILRSCGEKSLVFVDELSRGTSPRDGTRLAAAVLESMAVSGMSGIFATHLHDILDLPLKTNRLAHKRMAIHTENVNEMGPRWTYKLENGICTDSMALVTAAQFGIPTHVIERAEELSSFLPNGSASDTTPLPALARRTVSDPGSASIEEIEHMVESISGSKACQVLPGWNVPASYDGKSCLYILRLQSSPPRFYVGESDDVRKRLLQHRLKGPSWKEATALVVEAPFGKSEAREWETLAIRKLAARGYRLESIADGRRLRLAPTSGLNSAP